MLWVEYKFWPDHTSDAQFVADQYFAAGCDYIDCDEFFVWGSKSTI